MKHVYQNELLNIRNIQYISIYICIARVNICLIYLYTYSTIFYLYIIKYITEYKITYIVIYE